MGNLTLIAVGAIFVWFGLSAVIMPKIPSSGWIKMGVLLAGAGVLFLIFGK